MPLFGKRLTPGQETEVQDLVDSVNMVLTDWYRAYDRFKPGVIDLLRTCYITRSKGGQLETVDLNLVRQVRGTLQDYLVSLQSFESRFQQLTTEDWYPKNIRKKYTFISETEMSLVINDTQMALKGLEEPDPLSRKLGKDKLNVFVEGAGPAYEHDLPPQAMVWKR